MSRKLTPRSSLENLKREAKRWLKALRDNDGAARARLERSFLGGVAPTTPTLRDVQHALAREHGVAGWAELKDRVAAVAETPKKPNLAELANSFLEYACADPILANGPAAHARRTHAAQRILARYPKIAHANIHTAVVCGDLAEVERIIAEQPAAAVEPGGPQRRRELKQREKLWTPLLHLCYGRLQIAPASDNAVAIARLLLDHGANPNDYFEVGDGPHRYTALCGVAGEGEDDAPPHPRRLELTRLLLERGAEPYDVQLFYNTHFHANIVWLLELVYEYSIKAGRQADWANPEWSMINMGGYGRGARYFLEAAIANDNFELAEWLLAHGANPNAAPTTHPRWPKMSLHEGALRQGHIAMAELLARHGAVPSGPIEREPIMEFIDACFRLDRDEARALAQQHPEYLQSHHPIFAAAKRDRADVVALLLDLGTPIEVEDDSKQRPLHIAASSDALSVAELLVARGAEIEPVETSWNNTPLDHASYGRLTRMVDYLCGFTRDVYQLAFHGKVERLRALIAEDPKFATRTDDHATPLMWLPDDDATAIEVVELLLAHGADPTVTNEEGQTAADIAEQRALYGAAAILRE